MRINNNLMAMNTHRQLGLNNSAGAKSIEKLSSGLKINRAGDDAAGLAISEKMRSQIRGLNMASKNSQDGISLIQTAEGALNETHAILQRMRELAVQSSNDTNVTIDRGEIQKEMNQLSSEVNRIANTTEFNTMKLLNGDRAITTSTTRTTATSTFLVSGSFTMTDITQYTISGTTTSKNALGTGGITVAAGEFSAAGMNSGSITITRLSSTQITVKLLNNMSAGTTTKFSALDTLNADANGNFVYNDHGVSFTISKTKFATMTASAVLKITSISAGTTAISMKDDFTTNVTSTGSTVGAASITGGITVDSSKSDIDLKDVRKISITQTSGVVTINLLKADGTTSVHKDVFTLTAAGTLSYDAHGIKFDYKTVVSATTSVNASVSLTGLQTTSSVVTSTTSVTSDKSLKFQVGANQAQQMTLDVSDMRAKALKATSSAAGTQTLTIGTAGVTAYYVSTANVTDGTTSSNTEFALDVSDSTKAGAAITVINAAIENVSSERSKLGAVQNRLEHTIKNLDTSAENLQAAESRIRDVDMAKEMMNLTKNNILQQAAQAMLAQANQAPQGVLQLLR